MKFIILLGTITALGFELGVIRYKDMEWKTKDKTYQ